MIIRDALTRPHALSICRRDGHRWEGERCEVCRSRNIEGAVAGETMATGGYPVSYLEVRSTTTKPKAEKPEPPTVCAKGHPTRIVHVERQSSPYDQVVCDTCRAETDAARLALPCPAGHVGRRWLNGRSVRCHDCEAVRASEYRQRVAA